MTYISRVEDLVTAEMTARDHSMTPLVLQLYTSLVLVAGEKVTCEMVHDCWAIAKMETNPHHPNIVPFKELDVKTQNIDQDYVDGLKAVAREINTK